MLFYTCNLKKFLLKCPFSECRETPLEVQGVTVLTYPVMLRLYALVIQDKLIEAWFSAIVRHLWWALKSSIGWKLADLDTCQHTL